MHYEKNFLTAVVVRVDFEPIPALLGVEVPQWSQRIRERFPAVAAKPTAQLMVNFGPNGAAVNQQVSSTVYEHRIEGQPLPTVTLASNFVAIDYGATYQHFGRFNEDAAAVFQSMEQIHPDAKVSRIGLRYVNEVMLNEGHALDWDNLINPQMVAAVKTGMFSDMKIARSMHQTQSFSEDATLLVHYGLFNPDFPGELVRRHFVLDFDASRSGPLQPNQILPSIQMLNKVCERAFEESIENGLRDLMVVVHE